MTLFKLVKSLKVIHKLSTGTLKTLQAVDILWISLSKSLQVGGAGATGGVGWYIYKSYTFLTNIDINQLGFIKL